MSKAQRKLGVPRRKVAGGLAAGLLFARRTTTISAEQ